MATPRLPFSGERLSDYYPSHADIGIPFLMGEVQIPSLYGDQTVVLNKTTQLDQPCMSVSIPVSTGIYSEDQSYRLLNYAPFRGMDATGSPLPIDYWIGAGSSLQLNFTGDLENLSTEPLDFGGSGSGSLGLISTNTSGLSIGFSGPLNLSGGQTPRLPARGRSHFEQSFTLAGLPSSSSFTLTHELKPADSMGEGRPLFRDLNLKTHSDPPGHLGPQSNPVLGYSNLYSTVFRADRALSLLPLRLNSVMVKDGILNQNTEVEVVNTDLNLLEPILIAGTSTQIPSMEHLAVTPSGDFFM